jgi:hypothetical protein
MVAVGILLFSIIGLLRFAASYWRAILAGAAGQPVSEEVFVAANLRGAQISGEDFKALAGVHSLTPDGSTGLGFVSLYYRVVEGIGYLAKSAAPAIAAWTEHEMTACAQYVAVRIDRSLKSSLTLSENLGTH